MKTATHYHFQGELIAPPYPHTPVLARNHIFPLESESDYEINAMLDDLPARRSLLLPSELYNFIRELMRLFSEHGFEFDLILIQLGAPILEKVPDELLAPNVFISVDANALLTLAHSQGCARTLYIGNNFLINYVNDFGDNQIELNLYYDEDKTEALRGISTFLATRNIHGEFICP